MEGYGTVDELVEGVLSMFHGYDTGTPPEGMAESVQEVQ